jgi:hypothetical protein
MECPPVPSNREVDPEADGRRGRIDRLDLSLNATIGWQPLARRDDLSHHEVRAACRQRDRLRNDPLAGQHRAASLKSQLIHPNSPSSYLIRRAGKSALISLCSVWEYLASNAGFPSRGRQGHCSGLKNKGALALSQGTVLDGG